MKCVIVDDEKNAVEMLEWQILRSCPDLEIIGKFNAPEEALTGILNLTFDILFLDIEMPRMNGFELLEKIKNPVFNVIFTTAYDQFALKAFKFSAVDYLLKPIDKDDLIAAVEKVRQTNAPMELTDLKNTYDFLRNKAERLSISTQDGIEFVAINDIVHINSDVNYSEIYLSNGRKIVVAKTLKDFEIILEHAGFLRIHNSYLANIAKIEKYFRGDGGSVRMNNGTVLMVSRARKEELMKLLGVK